ncbi:MAG: cupin domain-containing protein, partial [Kiloniellales bacterium]
MTGAVVARIGNSPVHARGDGVETTLLIGRERCAAAVLTSGLTRFPAGKKVPFHFHNCDEQVTVIEGTALVEIEGQDSVAVGRLDTTYVPAGKSHRFVNTGDGVLEILWIYTTDHVTRTFTETGETVEHLSPGDRVSANQ